MPEELEEYKKEWEESGLAGDTDYTKRRMAEAKAEIDPILNEIKHLYSGTAEDFEYYKSIVVNTYIGDKVLYKEHMSTLGYVRHHKCVWNTLCVKDYAMSILVSPVTYVIKDLEKIS